jgi:hypothetical protein
LYPVVKEMHNQPEWYWLGALLLCLSLLVCCILWDNTTSKSVYLNVGDEAVYAEAPTLRGPLPWKQLCRYVIEREDRHQLHGVAVSGEDRASKDIYALTYLTQLVAQSGAEIRLTHAHRPEVQKAGTQLAANGIVQWKRQEEGQLIGVYVQPARFASLSEYLSTAMLEWIPVPPESKTKYYLTSQSREDEVIHAYQSDSLFTVRNVTSAVHGAVLSVLLPSMTVRIGDNGGWTQEEQELFSEACRFLA